MIIKIEEKALKYLLQKNKDSILIDMKRGSCWTGGSIPYVAMEKPKNLEDYNSFDVDGIKVYVAKRIKARNNEIRIVLNSLLFIKSLEVMGVEIY